MPDLDSGHIFLTTMAPILPGAPEHNPQTSHEQLVRIALAKLPPAHQSPATDECEFNSPFTRNTRTHLARMFVLNDAVFNGRITANPLLVRLQGDNQMIPRKVDHLKCAYLVFCADVDAIERDGDPLPATLTPEQQRKVRASYARTLWETMREELVEIYEHCYGFEGIQTADDFAAYLDQCHVETTMPFHDYYLELPKFNTLPLKPLLFGVAAPFILAALALVLWLFGFESVPLLGWPTLWTWIGALVVGGIAAYVAVRFAVVNGEKPLAPAKYDDLPSVLKSLYIQQKFADFFVEHQGMDPATLQAEFARFVEEHKPHDRHAMTQKPGVISSASNANVTP